MRDWLPWLLGLAAIWGCGFLLIKVAVTEVQPLWVAAGRLVFGALALGVIMLVRGLRFPRSAVAWFHCGVLGLVYCAIPFSLFAFAGERIPSVLSGMWNTGTPLVVLPLAVLAFRTEHFTVRRVAGLVLGVLGGFVLLGAWDLHGDGYDLAGQLMCLGAITGYGVGMAWTRKFLSPRPESPLVLAAMQMVTGSVIMVPAAWLLAGPVPVPGPEALVSVVLLGAVGTGIGFAINVRNIARLGASGAAVVTFLVPVVAAVVGAVALGERLAWHHLLGAGVVLLGVAIAQGVGRGARPAGGTDGPVGRTTQGRSTP